MSKPLRVLVGVQDEGLNGIETYAQQLAATASSAGHDVTLLTTTDVLAASARARTAVSMRVESAGLARRSEASSLGERLLPQLQIRRVGSALERFLAARPGRFDIIHLNRPALAPWAYVARTPVFVAAWFFPHAIGPRLLETWRHTQGQLPRRLVIALKSLAFYQGDARGYRPPTSVVACTETLAQQLREQGLRAFSCPPPVNGLACFDEPSATPQQELRLLVCSGDLSHPRKNLRDAVRATGILARSGRNVVLRAIGNRPEVLRYEARHFPANARLELLGPKQPHEVIEEMQKAHTLVLPSLYEEWGYVAVEALLSGTPVASYPVYPFHDMLSGGLGGVADNISPEALAAAIERCSTGTRGWPLAQAGDRRFGSAAVGQRLTEIWGADQLALAAQS